jgi:hypothetical protein
MGEDYNQNDDGRKKHGKIINGTPIDSLRILAAGLQGGMTSPSRPWFQLSLPDDAITEYEPVRLWLHEVRTRMLHVFSRSNFYGAVHSMYYELGGFGTAAMMIEEDDKSIIRCRPLTIGEYCIAQDDTLRPVSLYRQFSMTTDQLMTAFGKESLPKTIVDGFPQNRDQRHEVIHAVDRDPTASEYKMAYKSCYFLKSGDDDAEFLKEAGYKTIPFVCARWDVVGVDAYGQSPAMAALGDIKMLQKMEEKKLKALDKMVDPPLNVPSTMKDREIPNILAGGINYMEPNTNVGVQPAFQVQADMQNIAFEIDRVERRITRYFYNEMFLAVLNENKQMTAREVATRHEEKLMMLGPVLERLQSEFLDPVIDRVFNIMLENDYIPPAPPEIAGMDLKIEYVSMLAQAQKMIGSSGLEQFAGFVGQIAAADPKAAMKVKWDEMVDQYGTMLGVPPAVIRSDEDVEEMIAQQQQQQQMMQTMQMMQQAAGTAKDLGQTPVNQGQKSALDALIGNPAV